MKKKEVRMIAILIVIAIIVIIALVIIRNQRNQGEANTINQGQTPTEAVEEQEEYVSVLSDGTRLNTSSKLQETKTIDGMEITDIQLTEKDNVTLLLGTITNTTEETKGGYPANVTILDEEGNEIITIETYLGELEPGESTQFSTSATFDYANAYDFSITQK